jgi:putative membrane protein insertion efficiency factor
MFSLAIKKTILTLIKFYQATAGFRQPCCRFDPSCSQYAAEALEKYGIIKGLSLTFKRVASCHPFGRSGYDPVK